MNISRLWNLKKLEKLKETNLDKRPGDPTSMSLKMENNSLSGVGNRTWFSLKSSFKHDQDVVNLYQDQNIK